MDRNRRQRQRSAHNPRGVHLSDEVLIDAAACRALLDSGQRIDAASRLMLETAVAHGDGVLTVGELKRAGLIKLKRTPTDRTADR